MLRCVAVLAAGIMVLAAATPATAQLHSEVVVSGLTNPVGFVQDPSQANVQYVVEQGGRIRVVQNGALRTSDFLDLSADISTGGERGLLGLAFPADYGTSRRFYVNFTNPAGHTVIARFLRSPSNPFVADPATRFDLAWPDTQRFITQPFSNHNGGDLHFGPDGYLYIGLGDGGSGNDPLHLAQNPATLLGKMLRIDVSVALNHAQGYVVPATNPFVGQSNVLGEIWAFGYRNPWRFSFDSPARGGTGAMLIADVGQSSREEINYEPAGRGGRNYGWRNREGSLTNITTLPTFSTPLTNPLFEYGRSEGQVVAGGFIYRGTALGASYVGRYFFADLGSGRLWSLGLSVNPSTGEATATTLTDHSTELGPAATGVSSFGMDATGELYTVDYFTGQIFRIVPASASSGCSTVQPAPDWVCVNGGWLPPGLAPSTTPPPSAPPPPPPVTPPPSTGCATVQPAPDWVCVNGGWLPPGLAPAPTPPSTPPVGSPGTELEFAL